jgi:hypothetical protein
MKKGCSMIYPVMENLAENLKGQGALVLTRNLDPGKKYFSDDSDCFIQPGVYSSLGQLGDLTLLAGAEINWYSPGKIYMGVLASDTGFSLDGPVNKAVDEKKRLEILELLGLEPGDQKVCGRWIWWRYLTVDGRCTADTDDRLIPHFKVTNDAASGLDRQESMVALITAAVELWNDLVGRRLKKRGVSGV